MYPEVGKVEYNLNKPLVRQLPADITARSSLVLHYCEGLLETVTAVKEEELLEIASITKVMTCLLTLVICDKFGLDLHKERTIVSERASHMQGTSARLTYSDTCSIYELLHGLMLPSGNDAAVALGEWGGKTIRRYSMLLKR